MFQAKCPFYVSQSNGHKFYVNCNQNGKFANCIRTGFTTTEDRKNKLKLHCDHAYQYCITYQILEEAQDNDKSIPAYPDGKEDS